MSRLLVGKYAVLGIESLNVAGMDQLRHQARSVRDAAIGGLLLKIRYKADWYGTLIVEADRFFPSSKLCSDCGYHNAELTREAADELPDQLILGPVGPDVMLPDGKALAGDKRVAGETGPSERRTALSTRVSSVVDGGADGNAFGRTETLIPVQLRLAI